MHECVREASFVLTPLVSLPQTELLPHCSDVPPLARVVQEDGKLLMQALLEVRLSAACHSGLLHQGGVCYRSSRDDDMFHR